MKKKKLHNLSNQTKFTHLPSAILSECPNAECVNISTMEHFSALKYGNVHVHYLLQTIPQCNAPHVKEKLPSRNSTVVKCLKS